MFFINNYKFITIGNNKNNDRLIVGTDRMPKYRKDSDVTVVVIIDVGDKTFC